ncbi:hypothetical protein [Hathewaya limosa]|uniref:Uncharacterized protein n=1 Tax=Hathewaya limosa TaxID=1536 RepID=A0ABU0JVC9_HATLI|nr:hypothetical protein [Hathewaya limosa]MDQ0480176.1 hypothetical protein [Hathewaya limosa]
MRKVFLSSLIALTLTMSIATNGFAVQNSLWSDVKRNLKKSGQDIALRVTNESIDINEIEDENVSLDEKIQLRKKKSAILQSNSRENEKKTEKISKNTTGKKNIDQLYKDAYNATEKCLKLGTQESIKEAREAIGKLPKSLNWAIGEFSKQVDTKQHPIFVEIIKSIEKSKKSNKQEDINTGRELVKDVIEDQYKRTWSAELDKVQQVKIEKLVSSVKNIKVAPNNTLVLEKVEEELSDLNKVKYNDGVKKFVDEYSAEIFTQVLEVKALAKKYMEIVDKRIGNAEKEAIKNCRTSEELVEYLKHIGADKNKAFNAGLYWSSLNLKLTSEKIDEILKNYEPNRIVEENVKQNHKDKQENQGKVEEEKAKQAAIEKQKQAELEKAKKQVEEEKARQIKLEQERKKAEQENQAKHNIYPTRTGVLEGNIFEINGVNEISIDLKNINGQGPAVTVEDGEKILYNIIAQKGKTNILSLSIDENDILKIKVRDNKEVNDTVKLNLLAARESSQSKQARIMFEVKVNTIKNKVVEENNEVNDSKQKLEEEKAKQAAIEKQKQAELEKAKKQAEEEKARQIKLEQERKKAEQENQAKHNIYPTRTGVLEGYIFEINGVNEISIDLKNINGQGPAVTVEDGEKILYNIIAQKGKTNILSLSIDENDILKIKVRDNKEVNDTVKLNLLAARESSQSKQARIMFEVKVNTIKNKVVEKSKEVEIKSELVDKFVIGREATNQQGYLAFKIAGKKLTKNQTITVAGKLINLVTGDDSGSIKSKILKALENDPNWKFETGYVVVEEKGASVKFECREIRENVNNLALGTDEIEFFQDDEKIGDLGELRVKEKCHVTITEGASKDETLTLRIKGTVGINIGTVSVDVKKGDSTSDIAKKVENAFKANSSFTKYFKIELDESNSRVILTQKIANNFGTTVELVK